MCGSAHGSVRAVCAAVCGSALAGSVYMAVRAAVIGSMRVAGHGSVRAAVCDSALGCSDV
jgi:hypothetical protein